MELRIHNNFEEYEKQALKYGFKKYDLQKWKECANIFMSNDNCILQFANKDQDFWELHIAFDKAYRGKKSVDIIKQGINWMLDNKTSRVICGISKEKLNVRMLANQVGFNKVGSRYGYELYEIRR